MKKLSIVTVVILNSLGLAHSALAESLPRYLVFTYMGDPSTTLTANWQIIGDESFEAKSDAIVYYDTVSHAGLIEGYANKEEGRLLLIDGLEDRQVARVQLTDLLPGTVYYVVAGHSDGSFMEEVKVRTISDDESPLRFVTGGDMNISEDARVLLEHAASFNPDFAAVGGDIAYANGRINSVSRWDIWLDYYTSEMVTDEGFTIPLFLAIGNHEVNGAYGMDIEDAPFYYTLFGQGPDRSYFKRQFGTNFIMVALDSGHTNSHASQVEWLDETLSASKDVPFSSAIYHVPLYPSHRGFMGRYSEEGREFWAPVFDRHGLTVAFENHDHTFKRSHFIRGDAVVGEGEGTLYLGDGCWGVGARPVHFDLPWYLKTSGNIRHFWVVDVTSDGMEYRAVNLENQVFDVFPEDAEGAEEARQVFAEIDQEYMLPWDSMRSTPLVHDGKMWSKGLVTLTIENTFDYPALFQVVLRPHLAVVSSGFPEEPVLLEAGEQMDMPITLESISDSGLLLDKLRLSLSGIVLLQHPDHEEALQFRGGRDIPIENLNGTP